ncbi:MAG: ATP-binding cassette domain-containing protein [Oscillibacter sp.]|nr:ATP-binding cassette domain-containing protein [Oscillibacter sp.]
MGNSVFELKDIVKRFDVTVALNGVAFSAEAGEVIGLIGPNGAGKSTLMGILTGVTPATSGQIFLHGAEIPVKQYNTTIARQNGIACAYQEFSLCSNLKVYENFAITIMEHSLLDKPGWRRDMRRTASEYLGRMFPGSGVDVNGKVCDLPIEQKQMVEIACAAASRGLKVLILDEPTSSLTTNRIGQLHDSVRKLKESGVTVIYITHKLEEIKKISSRVVIMKNGDASWSGSTEHTTTEQLVDLMGGKAAAHIASSAGADEEREKLVSVSNLSTPELRNVSMSVYRGEVVGLSGLGGSGQRELIHEIYDAASGKKNKSIEISAKAAYVSGDRQNEGIFSLWSIADNIIISSLDQLRNWKLLSQARQDEMAQSWYDKLQFKAEGRQAPITSLSGGNQQKAIIGRGLASGHSLIIFDDPTRGVDIGTKEEVYRTLEEIRKEGKSVLWYSTEDNEMFQCDRVYVMRDGAVTHELAGADITEENLVSASFQEDTEKSGKKEAEAAKKAAPLKSLQPVLSSGSFIAAVILAVVWLVIGALNENAGTRTGMTYLIGNALPLVFVALGQMCIVLAGDINMGIGNAMGLCNVITATFLVESPLMGIAALIGFSLIYIASGVLIHKRNMPAIVVSLGMSSIWLGLGLVILPSPGGAGLDWLNAALKVNTPLVPVQIYLCAAAALLAWYMIMRSKYGMVMRGIGSNPKSVERKGWSHFRAHIALYALSAVFVILAGLYSTGISRSADPNASATYQMMSIATILLGGCKFSGGIVEPAGVVLGAVSVSLISSMLTFMRVDTNYRSAVIGVILLISLAGGEILKRRKK